MGYWILDNGVERPMTPEEVEAMRSDLAHSPPAPSEDLEIDELKAQLSSMEAAYVRGVNEA